MDRFFYFDSEVNPQFIAVMNTRYVRVDNIVQKASDQKESSYCFRFIRNSRFCDLYAEDETTFQEWRSRFARVFVQSDFHSKFSTLKMIGKGSFARVYLVENKESKERFAVKAFSKEFLLGQSKGKDSLINEMNVMRSLSHPNIMSLEEVHESANSIYLVTEMLEGGELLGKISSPIELGYSEVARVMGCIMEALGYLAEKNLMHRDLKPDNMIFKDNNRLDKCTLKLIDFGLATSCDLPEYLFKRCGTPGFVAPEVINASSSEKISYTPKCDVFSAGIIFYLLLTNKSPFEGKSFKDILHKNKTGKIDFKHEGLRKQPLALNLLYRMLEVDPERRISAREVLQHGYFEEMRRQESVQEEIGQLPALVNRNSGKNKDVHSPILLGTKESILAGKNTGLGRTGSVLNSFNGKGAGMSLKSMISPRKTSGHCSKEDVRKGEWLQNAHQNHSPNYGNNFTEEEIESDSEVWM